MFAPASAARQIATSPGRRKMRQSRGVPAGTGWEEARPKHQAASAARAAIMNIADGPSIQVSISSATRHPAAAPSRSTP